MSDNIVANVPCMPDNMVPCVPCMPDDMSRTLPCMAENVVTSVPCMPDIKNVHGIPLNMARNPPCMPENVVTSVPCMPDIKNVQCIPLNMVRIPPCLLESSFEKEMMEIERAKQKARRESEINSAILTLKTNLVLCSLCIIFVVFQRALNETVVLVSLTLFKSLIPILTSTTNFSKLKNLLNLFRRT